MDVFLDFKIVQMVLNRAKHHIYSSKTYQILKYLISSCSDKINLHIFFEKQFFLHKN